jgi:hypothetical protein
VKLISLRSGQVDHFAFQPSAPINRFAERRVRERYYYALISFIGVSSHIRVQRQLRQQFNTLGL